MNQSNSIHNYATYSPVVGARVFLAPGSAVIGRCFLGDDCSIFHNAVLRGDINEIRIGARTNIQDNTTLHLADNFGVTIGEGCVIGHNAVIHACVIGDNCTIGMGAIVMDGAEIGADSIVGAGALVTPGKKFPPGSLIVGSPAQVKRALSPEEIEGTRKMADKYCAVKDTFLATARAQV